MTTFAVMQPYFLPYAGYFQLIHAVDTFVLLDDAQYVKESFVNRNRIVLQGQCRWMTAPVSRSNSGSRIRETYFLDDSRTFGRLASTIRTAYPVSEGAPIVEKVAHAVKGLSGVPVDVGNTQLLKIVVEALGIGSRNDWLRASSVTPPMQRQDRIIEIGRTLGADCYVNLPGGRKLYQPESFMRNNINLMFLTPEKDSLGRLIGGNPLSVMDSIARLGVTRTRDLIVGAGAFSIGR